jgi:predicted dehydrogenase
LDGGVHHTAGLRLLLGPENPLVSISANTTQLQEHLPPVDTIEATAKAKNGAVGSLSLSFGTTYKGSEWTFAGEKGFVSISRDKVTVGDRVESVQDEKTGVPPEVRAWGESLVSRKPNPKQTPEEALGDLELLEAMLKSGDQGGVPIALRHQEL